MTGVLHTTKDDALTWLTISADSKPDSRWMIVAENPVLGITLDELVERLGDQVHKYRRSNGNQSIELTNRAVIVGRPNMDYAARGHVLDGVWIYCQPRDDVLASVIPCLHQRNGSLVITETV